MILLLSSLADAPVAAFFAPAALLLWDGHRAEALIEDELFERSGET
jgi:hypothetical protein